MDRTTTILEDLIDRVIDDPTLDVDAYLERDPVTAPAVRDGFERLVADGLVQRPMFDRYRIDDEIGRGGMGVVFRAFDRDLGRQLAIKSIQSDLDTDIGPASEVARRFRRESQLSACLQHPNILPVFGLIPRPDATPMLGMPLLQGTNLKAAIEQRVRDGIPFATRKLETIERVCDAIEYAHSEGVIHRDLKPSNIFLETSDGSSVRHGAVLVLDWGIAKRLGEPEDASSSMLPTRTELTAAGTPIGSASHMSPEQALGAFDKLDERTDVFAIGALLHHLLTGHAPFFGDTPEALVRRARDGDIVTPNSLRPGTPRELQAIARHAMAREPERRYPSVRALRDDLDAFRQHRAGVAWRDSWFTRVVKQTRRHPRVATVAAAAACVALAIVVAFSAYAHRVRLERQTKVAELIQSIDELSDVMPAGGMPEANDATALDAWLRILEDSGYSIWDDAGFASLERDLADPAIALGGRRSRVVDALEQLAVLLWANDYADLVEHADGRLELSERELTEYRTECSDPRGGRTWSAIDRIVRASPDPHRLEPWEVFLACVRREPGFNDRLNKILSGAIKANTPDSTIVFLAAVFARVGWRIPPGATFRPRDAWRIIAQNRPQVFEAHLRASDGHIRNAGNTAIAIVYGEAARAIRTGSPWPHYALANAYAKQGDEPKYTLHLLDEFVAKSEGIPAAFVASAQGFVHWKLAEHAAAAEAKSKHFAIARTAYRAAIDGGRNEHSNLARVCIAAGEVERAEAGDGRSNGSARCRRQNPQRLRQPTGVAPRTSAGCGRTLPRTHRRVPYLGSSLRRRSLGARAELLVGARNPVDAARVRHERFGCELELRSHVL